MIGLPFYFLRPSRTPGLTRSVLWTPARSLVLISLVEYGFTAWPSTVNSSLGLVLSLVILLFGVYYGGGDARRRSAEGAQQARDVRKEEDVVVPAVWAARPSDDLKRD